MTFGTLEELLLIATVKNRKGSVVRVSTFARDRTKFELWNM
jgi:hypothetical protein